MRRIADGENRAVSELYLRFAPRMTRVAAFILQSRVDAEDVVQWAMARLWRDAAQFSTERGTLLAWFATIVRRRAIDLLRMRDTQRRAGHLLAVDVIEPVPPGCESLLRAENRAEVRTALDSLVAAERSAISLSYFGGMTHEEIARRLATPVGTVKARIRRGMLKLRPVLLHLQECR